MYNLCVSFLNCFLVYAAWDILFKVVGALLALQCMHAS